MFNSFMWQDYAFFIGQLLFFVALIPAMRHQHHKPPLSSCLLTFAILLSFIPANLSLGLYLATAMTGVTASAWGILVVQRLLERQRNWEKSCNQFSPSSSNGVDPLMLPPVVEFCCVDQQAFAFLSLERIPLFQGVNDQGYYERLVEMKLYCAVHRPPYDIIVRGFKGTCYFNKQPDRVRVTLEGAIWEEPDD